MNKQSTKTLGDFNLDLSELKKELKRVGKKAEAKTKAKAPKKAKVNPRYIRPGNRIKGEKHGWIDPKPCPPPPKPDNLKYWDDTYVERNGKLILPLKDRAYLTATKMVLTKELDHTGFQNHSNITSLVSEAFQDWTTKQVTGFINDLAKNIQETFS